MGLLGKENCILQMSCYETNASIAFSPFFVILLDFIVNDKVLQQLWLHLHTGVSKKGNPILACHCALITGCMNVILHGHKEHGPIHAMHNASFALGNWKRVASKQRPVD